MYIIIKNVIVSGRYELKDILTKIDTLWVQGTLTDEERTELVSLAQTNATSDMGYQSLQEQISELRNAFQSINDRLKTLENADVDTEINEYPQYKQPTCAEDAYYTGDKMTYNGVQYICIAPEGYAVAYPPDILPGMWQTVE